MKKIENTPSIFENVEISKTDEIILYKLYSPLTNDEYYSYHAPVINLKEIALYQPFKKETVNENVLKEEIEEYYKAKLNLDNDYLYINLSEGLIISFVEESSLIWLQNDITKAKELLKEKSLEVYKTMIPKLTSEIDKLATMVTHFQQNQNHPALNPQKIREQYNINEYEEDEEPQQKRNTRLLPLKRNR